MLIFNTDRGKGGKLQKGAGGGDKKPAPGIAFFKTGFAAARLTFY